MKTNFKVVVKAHHYGQIRNFRMQPVNNGGIYTAKEYFETEEEAKAFLLERANWASEKWSESEEWLTEAKEKIKSFGVLELDEVAATIEELEEWELRDLKIQYYGAKLKRERLEELWYERFSGVSDLSLGEYLRDEFFYLCENYKGDLYFTDKKTDCLAEFTAEEIEYFTIPEALERILGED